MRSAVCSIVALACLQAAPLRAEAPSAETWQFDLTGYAWAIGIEGDVTARGQKSSVDASFIDILDSTDSVIGLMGRFGAHKGDWGFYFDTVYTRLGAEDGVGNTDAKVKSTSEVFMLEGAVTYQIGTWALGREDSAVAPADRSRLALQVYGGARFTNLNLELKLEDRLAERSVDKTHNWVDPIIGARTQVTLDSRWQILVGADIGGFGVGSDFTWQALGLVSYRFEAFGVRWMASGGYRALYQDYKTGSGNSAFEWDVTLHGPIIGLTAQF